MARTSQFARRGHLRPIAAARTGKSPIARARPGSPAHAPAHARRHTMAGLKIQAPAVGDAAKSTGTARHTQTPAEAALHAALLVYGATAGQHATDGAAAAAFARALAEPDPPAAA
jgi:hypothetical protein